MRKSVFAATLGLCFLLTTSFAQTSNATLGGKEFEFRADAINVLNHPNFDLPNANINSTGTGTTTGPAGTNVPFGRIISSAGERRFVISGRLNF